MIFTVALLLRAVLGLAGLLLLMLGYLVVRKIFENVKSKRIAAMKDFYQQHVYGYLLNGTETRTLHIAGGRWKEEAMEELLLQCATLFRGSDAEERFREYAGRHLMPLYRKQLSSRRFSRRVNTLLRIERFDLRESAPVLSSMAAKPGTTAREISIILKLLARWGIPGAIDLIRRHGESLSEYQKRTILSQLPDEQFRGTMRGLDRLSASWRYAAIDIVGLMRSMEFGPELDLLAESDDAETRIRALKAISQFGVIEPKETYLAHAESERWEERMMAAKLFGTIRDNRFNGVLARLLGDPVWFVRSQAAQSLSSYPQGAAALKEIAAASDDRFAREMAAEWLERGGEG